VRVRPLTEKQFMAQVVQLAKLQGWLVYHTFDSRRSTPGFPDLVMLRDGTLLVAELKTGNNRLSPSQAAWLVAFRLAGVAASVWRPGDWNLIEKALAKED
jgi:hypothetical protein